jgi:hypothetical protein
MVDKRTQMRIDRGGRKCTGYRGLANASAPDTNLRSGYRAAARSHTLIKACFESVAENRWIRCPLASQLEAAPENVIVEFERANVAAQSDHHA